MNYKIEKISETDANGDVAVRYEVKYLVKRWILDNYWKYLTRASSKAERENCTYSTIEAAQNAIYRHRAANNALKVVVEELTEEGEPIKPPARVCVPFIGENL